MSDTKPRIRIYTRDLQHQISELQERLTRSNENRCNDILDLQKRMQRVEEAVFNLPIIELRWNWLAALLVKRTVKLGSQTQ